ncbi:LOW QUALITY PROTEIN: Na(+)/H(+) exchange regulatory cofactor NHE-RF2 [Menidia menidia]
MDTELRPRLCFLIKGERGYGFHLHGERNRGGQFIRKVEPGSSADMAGLRPGDRVVEVNGENVEKETHHQVVSRIREVPHRTRLLVVDRQTDEFLRVRGLPCAEELAVEMGTLSPRPSPMATPCASPLPREGSPPSHKPGHNQSFPFPAAQSPPRSAKGGKTKTASETSSSATDPEPEPRAELLPRLCHLLKGGSGYGFNLYSDRKKGVQFVRSVDPDSPAQRGGVRAGDRVLEVNGVTTGDLRHSEVVALIRAGGQEVRLLVVDQNTDELFLRLGIMPTSSHIREVYVDEAPPPPPPPPTTDTPIISVTMTDSPVPTPSPKSRTNGSSASQSSSSSTSQSEISSSDMSFQVPEEDDRRVSDPLVDCGLRLSPTAAEAKQKVLATRSKKRAPPMDWSKKQELFSNF